MDIGDCSADGTCEEGTNSGQVVKVVAGVKLANTTLMEETTMALQQLSVVLGVALMVGFLFFLMIAIDKTFEWIGDQWDQRCGRENNKGNDVEDPAALVGSFKRYK